MHRILLPIGSLLLGVAMLFLGNGLINSLVPIQAGMAGFSPGIIGFLGAAYFCGFLLGCVLAPDIVRRRGHSRAFAAFASLATAGAIIHGMLSDPIVWILLRLTIGFTAAALYLIVESWLNAHATGSNRGTVMGLYALINYGALALGQQLLPLAETDGHFLFLFVALVTSLAVIPITLTRHDAPALPPAASLPLRSLWALSPAGAAGCFLNGLTNGPFWSLGPNYAREIGLSLSETALFMSVPIIAGALSAWPVGLISDHIDRRLVVVVAWSVVTVVSALLVTMMPREMALLGAMALFGAAIFPVNSLYVAHVNDVMTDGDRVAISSGLILIFGIGATVGPLMAGELMARMGPAGLFCHIGVVAFVGLAYTAYRLHVGAQIYPVDLEPYQMQTRKTHGLKELDPR
ncbi:MAG: MFS transporter, partial [Alphaproteobacteria bacterium]